MSIEQKIAALLEESKKLQAEEVKTEEATANEVVAEEAVAEEVVAEDQKPQTRAAYKVYSNSHNDPEHHTKHDSLESAKAELAKHKGGALYNGNKLYNKKSGVFESVESQHEELTVDVSEDVAALVNGEDLSEEFKTKAATIFEAAVVTRVKQEVAKLEEEFDTKLAEQVESIKEGLVEKVDGYLNYVVEQWMTDNELALENGMKSEIMESFITGMKGLFEQHYIDVPEEKFDMLGELQEEVEVTSAKLDEQLAANVELTKQINEMKRLASIAESSADMTAIDVEKFKGLAEELAYEDADSFKTKLQTIKENYFGKKVTTTVSSVVTDEPVQLTEETTLSPQMAAALRALGGK
jgi:hypothetical protein